MIINIIESQELKKQASDQLRKSLIDSGSFDADTIDTSLDVFNTIAADYDFVKKKW